LAAGPNAPPPNPTTPRAPDSRLAVLAIALTGSDDESLAAACSPTSKGPRARGAFTIVDPAEVERHARRLQRAALPHRPAHATASADFALRAVVAVDDRDYVVHLELLAAADGNVLASSEERCDLCGSPRSAPSSRPRAPCCAAPSRTSSRAPAPGPSPASPPGALVLVDNQLVGTTPVDQPVLEGEHVVRVRLDGYVSDEREVKLVSRRPRAPRPPAAPRPAAGPLPRSIGWASLFTGIPVSPPASACWHRRPLEAVRRRGNIDAGNCRFLFNTDYRRRRALAAGGALITIGAMLLLRTRDRPQSRRPRAFIGPTGVAVVGRF
jgi:hypothetical protein